MFSFRSFVLVSAFVLAGCNGCTSDSAPDASVDVTVETAVDVVSRDIMVPDATDSSTLVDASLDARD